MNAVIFFLLLLLAVATDVSAGTFTSDFMAAMGRGRYEENILFSPASIQQIMGMLFIGATEESANQLQAGLELDSRNNAVMEAKVNAVLDKTVKEGGSFKVANRLYVNERDGITPQVEKTIKSMFRTAAVPVATYKTIGNDINAWVEQQTSSRIDHFISDDENWSNNVVLINNIYLKASWATPFPKSATRVLQSDQDDKKGKKTFRMMSRECVMPFGKLNKLDAYAAVIKLKGTDIDMLVLLPTQSKRGVGALEAKLRDVDLRALPKTLKQTKVTLKMPRISFEYDIPLKKILEGVGLQDIFSNPHFAFLQTHEAPAFTEIRQKTLISIDEDGVELAAATGVEVHPPMYAFNQHVNRQFFFALLDEKNVYFAGHVTNV